MAPQPEDDKAKLLEAQLLFLKLYESAQIQRRPITPETTPSPVIAMPRRKTA